jgi:hypothetical protein
MSSDAAGRLALVLVVAGAAAAPPGATAPRSRPSAFIQRLLEGAHAQVGVTLYYDGSYRPITFPGGDVPLERGVCADVLVRAYRSAGIDLQALVHRDMQRAFEEYPRQWGLSRPDPNIDHRRVANLVTFFRRHGEVLPLSSRPEEYEPGDIVTWRLPSGRPHIGLVSDRSRGGRPLVIHNLRTGVKVEDTLFSYPVTGHYRYGPESPEQPRGRSGPQG